MPLLTGDLVGQRPVLTGPRSLTQAEMVTAIGQAIGRPLHFAEVSREIARQGMIRAGFPEQLADVLLATQAESFGQPGLVSGEVERILGRPGSATPPGPQTTPEPSAAKIPVNPTLSSPGSSAEPSAARQHQAPMGS